MPIIVSAHVYNSNTPFSRLSHDITERITNSSMAMFQSKLPSWEFARNILVKYSNSSGSGTRKIRYNSNSDHHSVLILIVPYFPIGDISPVCLIVAISQTTRIMPNMTHHRMKRTLFTQPQPSIPMVQDIYKPIRRG